MSKDSGIEWTEATWNPTVGCEIVSTGCKFCYAKEMHARLRAMGSPKYSEPFEAVKPWPKHLQEPLKWNKPTTIFVNSMADIFHDLIPFDYTDQIMAVMNICRQHTFQVLTKRPERMAEYFAVPNEILIKRIHAERWKILHARGADWAVDFPEPAIPPWVWMGTSVEHRSTVHRIDALRRVPACVRFLSCEPLVGPLGDLDLSGIGWVIAGGESGKGARACDLDWLRSLRDQCQAQGVPFFLKQLGGWPKKRGGEEAVLDGRRWVEVPR